MINQDDVLFSPGSSCHQQESPKIRLSGVPSSDNLKKIQKHFGK